MRRGVFSGSLAPAPTERDREILARSFDIEGLRLTRTAGLVVMDGQVPCYRMKKLAGAAAGRIAGAVQVVNRLRVVPQRHCPDSELVRAVQTALEVRAGLGHETIAVSGRNGIVTLRGIVSSYAVRCEAVSVAWAVGGVVGVENRLRPRRLSAKTG